MADQLGHFYGNVNLSANAHAVLGDVHHHYHYAEKKFQEDVYAILHQSLSFEGMHSRMRNIEMPLPNTCQWLRLHPLFLSWIDHSRVAEHQGLLWIKGKPGSGKSTILKDTLDWARKEWSDQPVLSYFFNARATTELERSCLGLYRSLVYQLLSACVDVHPYFLNEFSTKELKGKVEPWTETELQNFFLRISGSGYVPRLNVFIDALDEGDYDNVWRMITFFEKIADSSVSIGTTFRLCLSSRHYPHFNIESGLTVILESQPGHRADIELYIQKTFPGKRDTSLDEIRDSLLRKAEGIFLWVVLSIMILKPLYSRGRIKEMKDRLTVLPTGLYGLFSTILTKNAEDLDDCVTLLQWMLVGKKMFTPRELYLGLQFRDASPELGLAQDGSMDASMVTNYVIDCSKGFIELTEESEEVKQWHNFEESDLSMQFIHESVRQFLTSLDQVSGQARDPLICHLDFSSEACNLVVAEGCLRYLLQVCRNPPVDEPVYISRHRQFFRQYPLAQYVAKYWWQHMQAANANQNSVVVSLAQELLTLSPRYLSRWVEIYDMDYDRDYLAFPTGGNKLPQPLYYVALIGLPVLLSEEILWSADLNAQGGYHGSALQAASARGRKEMVQSLLDRGADVNDRAGWGGHAGNALRAAIHRGHKEIVQLLLERGAGLHCPSAVDRDSALRAAIDVGHKEIVRLLLDRGAKTIQQEDIDTYVALYAAALRGHKEVVELLLDRGSEIDAVGGHWGSALGAAARGGKKEVVQLLLQRAADVNMQGGIFGNALNVAAYSGRTVIVQLLLENGACVDTTGCRYPDVVREAIVRNSQLKVDGIQADAM